jgi:glutathione synthase
MKLLFIVDPLDGLKAYKDSSIAMMRAAVRRGHSVLACEPRDLLARDGQVYARAVSLQVHPSNNDHWFQAAPSETLALTAVDAVLQRKDPPFDLEYLYATLLLAQAESAGARVYNKPQALRDYNEKLAILKFPEFTAPTMVARDPERLHAFIEEHDQIVLKRLDGMGGAMIFRVAKSDPNRNVIVETMTALGTTTVMAQKYIPAISEGDKRILVVDGKPAPYALARIPKAGESRGNLAAGGRGEARPLTARDRTIAEAVGARVAQEGLLLVGLDVIGDYLTEVNVTSPTCMVEIAEQTGCDIATLVIEAIEARAAKGT